MVTADEQPRPPLLLAIQRVVPMVQTHEEGVWAVTAIAAELYDDGFRLTFYLYGAGQPPMNPSLVLRVHDDRGNAYGAWGGNVISRGTPAGCDSRQAYGCAPRFDPAARALRIAVGGIRS